METVASAKAGVGVIDTSSRRDSIRVTLALASGPPSGSKSYGQSHSGRVTS